MDVLADQKNSAKTKATTNAPAAVTAAPRRFVPFEAKSDAKRKAEEVAS